MSLLLFAVAFGMSTDQRSWKDKMWSVGSWAIGGLSFGLATIRLYTMGRACADTWIAIGPDGVRLRLPKSDGELLVAGKEKHLKWNEIRNLSFERNMGKRVCRFTAGEYIYTLNQNNCPSPEIVARLFAERKGVVLNAPEASV